ncbi:MAG: ferritin family protein [Spirochaetes bacterium]|nr:ferritin family protein [Spirochaetota bacterium]
MDIFVYAMQMEKDGEDLYRNLAKQATSVGVRNILTTLANAEVKHYNYLKNLAEGVSFDYSNATNITEINNLFTDMKKEDKTALLNETQIDLYRKALEIENKSTQFYRDKFAELDNPFQKSILEHLAKEEEKHAEIIQVIIDFIREPEKVDNAEFPHLIEEF